MSEMTHAQMLDSLLRDSMAEWPRFVSAAERPDEWNEWFASIEPGANLNEWRIDTERCIAYGPNGQIIVA